MTPSNVRIQMRVSRAVLKDVVMQMFAQCDLTRFLAVALGAMSIIHLLMIAATVAIDFIAPLPYASLGAEISL